MAGIIAAATIGAGSSLVGGYLGAKGAKDAARTSAGASRYAADLQQEQYLQGRQDLQPYRNVAVGEEIYSHRENYQAKLNAWKDGGSVGAKPVRPDNYDEVTGYTGGALNTLSDYGRSQVDPNSHIPQSDIPRYNHSQVGNLPSVNGQLPQYNVQGNIPQFNVQGNVPEFDGTQFDIYKDPSYDFRQQEQERAINRNMGSMGKVTSGNRLDEIMKRSGEMASQEFGAARGRMLDDYNISRQNENTNYNRDVFGYQQGRANEGEQYSRDNYGYGMDRANSLTQYGFDTDTYNRGYTEERDQYGRDNTAYNADAARENSLYGRGVDNYSRAYGEEGDYLNRLSALSNIGQTATNSGNTLGANAAANQGNAIQNAGNATAAGQIGQANAYGNAIDQISQAAGNYFAPTQNYSSSVQQPSAPPPPNIGFQPTGFNNKNLAWP